MRTHNCDRMDSPGARGVPRRGRRLARPRVAAILIGMARCWEALLATGHPSGDEPVGGRTRGARATGNRIPRFRRHRRLPAIRPAVVQEGGASNRVPHARREDLGSPFSPRSSRRRRTGDEASRSDPRQGVLPPQARSCCALRLRVSDRRTGVGHSCPTQFPLADTDIGVCRTVGHDSLLLVFHENASDRPMENR